MKQPIVIQTERLTLRPFRLSDAADVQRMAGDREVAKMTLNIPYPYEDGMAETWIQAQPEQCDKDHAVVFAIASAENDRLIGAIGLHDINLTFGRTELGYWIGKPYWGQGFCTEAATAVVRYAFETLGFHRVHSSHLACNPASGRVMQKIGMQYEGCQRQHVQRFGEYHDLVLYGLVRAA